MPPIVCPKCGSWEFVYKSDRTGNVRRYRCKSCGIEYVATVKGLSSTSAVSEPKNLDSKDLYWQEVRKQ